MVAQSSEDPHIAPFTGGGRLASSFVVIPNGGSPKLGYLSPMERQEAALSGLDLLTPEQLDILRWSRDGCSPDELWANVLSRALHLCGMSPGTLGIAGSLSAGLITACCRRLEGEGWSFVPAEPWLDRRRKVKSDSDLDGIREAAAGTCSAFHRVAEILRQAEFVGGLLRWSEAPLTVGVLRREVGLELCRYHLTQPSQNIIAPAEEGAVPHNTGTDDRVLRAGESLVVDIFPKGRLFADCTRTFCVGPPSKALGEGHRWVEAALELAESQAEVGVLGWDLQNAVCELLGKAGYPTPVSDPGTTRGYVHGLGHGVGFELHELPSFRLHAAEDEGRLEVGDVVTLEPGLYDEAAGWAVRIEDLYVVGENGLENLTPLPRTLDPKDW